MKLFELLRECAKLDEYAVLITEDYADAAFKFIEWAGDWPDWNIDWEEDYYSVNSRQGRGYILFTEQTHLRPRNNFITDIWKCSDSSL